MKQRLVVIADIPGLHLSADVDSPASVWAIATDCCSACFLFIGRSQSGHVLRCGFAGNILNMARPKVAD